jgi:hypothetical protein
MWRPWQANDLVPLETDILLKLFRPRAGLAKLYEGAENFFSRVEASVYWYHISDYYSDVLAPVIGRRPRQMRSCPAP